MRGDRRRSSRCAHAGLRLVPRRLADGLLQPRGVALGRGQARRRHVGGRAQGAPASTTSTSASTSTSISPYPHSLPPPPPLHLPQERAEEIHKSSLREPEALRELHQFAHKFCREERKKNIDVRRTPLTPHTTPHAPRPSRPSRPAGGGTPPPDPDPDPEPHPSPRGLPPAAAHAPAAPAPPPRHTRHVYRGQVGSANPNPHPDPNPNQVGSARIMLKLLLEPLYEEHVESLSRFLEQHAEVGKHG